MTKKKLFWVLPKKGGTALRIAATSKDEAIGLWRQATSSGTPLVVIEEDGEVLSK